MGLFDSFTQSLGNFFGVGGGSGAGGTRDAYDQYRKYIDDISPVIERYSSQIAGEGYNPYTQSLSQPYQGLDAAVQQAGRGASRIRGLASQLPGQLRASALASTQGAQQAAVNAARLAAGGRGGLAYGGGAGALAARAAQSAATQQSTALTQAMLQGTQTQLQAEQMATGIQQGMVGQRLGLAQALSQSRGQQAALVEAQRNRLDALRLADIQGRYGMAGGALYGGLQGQGQQQNRRLSIIGALLGGGS